MLVIFLEDGVALRADQIAQVTRDSDSADRTRVDTKNAGWFLLSMEFENVLAIWAEALADEEKRIDRG